MSLDQQNEENLENYESVTIQKVDFQKVIEKIDQLEANSKQKDSKIKSSTFFIKKLNEQLQDCLKSLEKKDQTIKFLKEEIKNLEKKNLQQIQNQAKFQTKLQALEQTHIQTQNQLRKQELMNEDNNQRIEELNKFNNTLTSEKFKLKQINESIEQHKIKYDIKEFQKQKQSIKKLQKNLDYYENQNQKLKNLNKQLMKKLQDAQKSYQKSQFQNLFYDKSEESVDFFDKLEQQTSKSQCVPPKRQRDISETKSMALNKSFESKIKFFSQQTFRLFFKPKNKKYFYFRNFVIMKNKTKKLHIYITPNFSKLFQKKNDIAFQKFSCHIFQQKKKIAIQNRRDPMEDLKILKKCFIRYLSKFEEKQSLLHNHILQRLTQVNTQIVYNIIELLKFNIFNNNKILTQNLLITEQEILNN